ncbi:Janus kinase and microtubule-interacting protein 1 [Lucilia cuprina]|nr:Janus kinase and microtubule-interacting protein 1 [Lucilia cuprina]
MKYSINLIVTRNSNKDNNTKIAKLKKKKQKSLKLHQKVPLSSPQTHWMKIKKMADKLNKTTSSISLEKQQPINMTKMTSPPAPNRGEVLIVTRLAENITDSYRLVKQKQQKFNDLTNQQHHHNHQKLSKFTNNESSNNSSSNNNNTKLIKPILKTPTDEWQEVCSPKNKLKRKKTLSASLTSVTDSVNQEKRTRIEGMQLNCRGRLHIKENIATPTTSTTVNTPAATVPSRTEKLAGKPPLPPSSKQTQPTESKVLVNPPPRLKRKLQENVQTIQKLNALTEQLRLEINELKSSLTTEKGAVRVLRAQNESEARKWKTEVKKLQNAVELLKKAGANNNNKKCDTASTNNENNLPQAAMGGLVNYEIQRLTNEINALKEANKALEEKKVINCDADRRKAADIRELKDSYEIRLTQIQKSAKNEISRLLEEIKTKERNIGQLKKDLQILQNSKTTSRNATTNNTNLTNNKTTNSNLKLNQNNKKPKSSITNAAQKQNEDSSKDKESSKETTTTTKNKDSTKKAEYSEISKLKNIELINNTKNVTTNLQKSTKILNTHHNNVKETATEIVENNNEQNNAITIVHLKALEIPDLHNHNNSNNNNCNNNDTDDGGHKCCIMKKKPEPLLLTTATQTNDTSSLINSNRNMIATAEATTQTTPPTTANLLATSLACDVETDHFDEQHITQELTQHLQNKAIQDAKENHEHDHHHHHRHHHHHHHHHHNNHSDSDSALSSAPTSISPQPPANGEEPTDIWQTMRSYTNDIEKLQKEVDLLQKQNEQLKQELNIAKEQIIELETNAMESANNTKIPQLMERIKYLEEQEHELQAEANDLREQNELLEFRILELEETNDKWSLQSHTNPASESSESMQTTTVANNTQNLWSCPGAGNKPDPFEMLFGNNSHTSQNASIQLDSGIISPQSQHHHDDLIDISNEELCRRLGDLLKKSSLEEDERHCLQQVLNLVQQLDALTPRSGPNSLNVTSSSDEASSLDLVKSRISDYSSASTASTNSARSTYDSSSLNSTKVNTSNSSNTNTPSRIVATVQPYNSTAPYTPSNSHQLAPHNTPTDSPRKARCQPWQTNSLSESGVFVESDFYSDASENNVCTQTDFEDGVGISSYSPHHIFNSPTKKVPVQQQNSSNLTDQKRLQYYKERVEVLESKVLIYESSGDVQAKRLAERLQREILLEKEVNELRDRVEFLESENSTLEEEKCEFEEAENDTRLRLQRLEVELEILSQRNVELEMSREALSAKYKDCHSECFILRDDLAASETQIRHLEEDKQKAKENLEFLHSALPLLLICNTYCTLAQVQNQNYQVANAQTTTTTTNEAMGNQGSNMNLTSSPTRFSAGGFDKDFMKSSETSICQERELQYLKEEVKCLRHQIKELNSRHYAAMESADSHWVDLEREYKEREEQYRAKEMCLKQKIQKLQDCLREDARSANEKICQLEEAEQGLKTCLVRVSKDHQKLQEDHQLMVSEFDRFKEQHEQVREQQKPLTEALENEKKRNKGLIDELTFMRKLQQETESQSKKELESVRGQMFDLKKDFLHIEVTNGELREEVATLEYNLQIQSLEKALRESEEKIRCLTDEIRTKDEICQKLEKRLERSEGYSLADELGDSPSKRFKREDIKDLKTASKGLGQALRHMGDCERMLPTQKQFKTIARDVKKLADTLLQGDAPEEEVSDDDNGDNFETFRNKTENENTAENIKSEQPNETQSNNDVNKDNNYTLQTDILQPLATSTPNNQSLEDFNIKVEDIKTEVAVNDDIKQEETNINITVGMAFIPPIRIDDSLLPSCSQKKAICEVPSELRKLASPSEVDQRKTTQSSSKLRRGKRFAKKRMTRGRISNLHLKVNRMVSWLFDDQKPTIFQDASDLDINRSEVLQRNISYGSFHSLREDLEEITEAAAKVFDKIDVSVECELKSETKEIATIALIEKIDSCIQVNDEIAVDLQLEAMPTHIRCLLNLLKASATNTKLLLNSSLFNMKICHRWKADEEFRQGLEILATLSLFNSSDSSSSVCLNSYEEFVSVMNCINVLEDMFKPYKILLLQELESEINERLMVFHNLKKESEFYCTVYYPIKFCCDRSTCPKRQQLKEDSSIQSSSIEGINQKANKETQMTASVTTTSSERNSVPASEYKLKYKSYFKEFGLDFKTVLNQMEDPDLFKRNLKQLNNLNKKLVNSFAETSRDFKSYYGNLDCIRKRVRNSRNIVAQPIYLEIPLEIHLKVVSKCLNAPESSNVRKSNCNCTLNKQSDNCATRSNQTKNVCLFNKEFETQCCCYVKNSEDIGTKTKINIKCCCKANSKQKVCNCEREKLSLEEYNELMRKPSAKLSSIICENKLKCICDVEKPLPTTEPIKKIFRLAYPQHKDVDVCIKCRFEPSPLIDENGRIFCPGNCGCCLCAWKPRATASLEAVFRHKNYEKSSEAYFNRHNQNLSSCHNKFCPSNSSHTSQLESQMCAALIQCSLPCVAQSSNVNRSQCCFKCMRLPQTSYNTTTASSLSQTSRPKCSCNQLDITTSSSSSFTSEHFPVKLNRRKDSTENNMPLPKIRHPMHQSQPIFVSSTLPKPERLQPLPMRKYTKTTSDQFYSCSSEESDTEYFKKLPVKRSIKREKSDKNVVILELLHEVVHLINKDNPIRNEAMRITQVAPSSLDDKSSKMGTQSSKIRPECSYPPITPTSPLTWHPPPCLCCNYSMAFRQNPPVIQPYNLMSSTAATPPIPEPFIYETEDSFKDCSSGNKLLKDESDNLDCICSQIAKVCPKHGSLKEQLKKGKGSPKSDVVQLVCTTSSKNPKPDSSEDYVDEELHPRYVKIKAYDPQKDCTFDLKCIFVDDDEEPRWQGKPDVLLAPVKTEEYVDEELHPRYVDNKCIDPCDGNKQNLDCLLKYEDEEPKQAKEPKQEVDEELQPTFAEQNPFYNYEPCQDCLMKYDDEEPSCPPSEEELQPFYDYEPCQDCLMEYDDEDPSLPENFIENPESQEENLPTFESYEPCLDCLPQYDEEDPSRSDINLGSPEVQEESLEPYVQPEQGDPDQLPKHETIPEIEQTSQRPTIEANDTLQVTETERSPFIVETSPTTGRNVYNFLPEIDRPNDPKQIIRYQESEEEFDSYYREEESELIDDEEYELAKEKIAESRKRKKLDVNETPTMALAKIKQPEGEVSPEEMKFFIDSLIMDFEAMDYARRKSQFEKNICKSKSGMCARESFPVTITEVTDLGANSLYVKWIIHDCCGIGGYEIYTDGYLTNRYYNSRHEAAVITQVDVTLPHKVALVAQPSAEDESLELMCNITKAKNKPKCLPWKTDVEKQQKSCAALWTPSIFLYNPDTCRATMTPPIMRDNF